MGRNAFVTGDTYLLPGLQLIPPLLHQLVVLFIQMLELLSLILNQQVTFFILKHKTRSRYQLQANLCCDAKATLTTGRGRMQTLAHLQLLQLPDVALALADHLSHLVLVFLLLMQSLRLLPLLLLLGKLKRDNVV